MEFDTKYREDLTYQPVLLSNSYPEPEIDDDFCFESCSSKGFFQDLHHLDQFSFNGSSVNPEFGVQTACLDPLDPFTSGCSPNLDDFYESKPFTESGGNGTNAEAMQSFRGGDGGGGGGAGYLNYPKKTLADASASDGRSSMPFKFNCQDIKPVNFVIPDEGSCITAENGYYNEVGTRKSSGGASAAPPTRNPCKSRKKSNSVKGQWTIEEDRLLIHMVEKYGVRKWSHIAQMLKGRIGKQCRERWHNHLRPDIKKDTWSEEEDKILIQAHAEIGNKWAEIAKSLPGRTENSIKNHWNATKRRQYSRRKCRSKYPRPSSLLQNYIKSLNLDGKSDINPTNAPATGVASLKVSPPPPPPIQPETVIMEFCSGDRSVPNYDFTEFPEFAFSENLFEESSSIDSLLDHMACPPPVDDDEKSFDLLVPLDDHVDSFMQCEVEKQMDLMEMMNTQVNL